MKKSSKRNIYTVLLGFTLTAIGLLLYNDFDQFRGRTEDQAVGAAPALTVSPWRDKLQLKWDPASEALRGAERADVLITDGSHYTRIALAAAALRNGNIVYTPQTEDVSFELHTFGPTPEIASVRYIGAVAPGSDSEHVAAGKPEPFGDKPVEAGDADRTIPSGHSAVLTRSTTGEVRAFTAAEPAPPARHGVLTRVKHGFARLWPIDHNSPDGGQR